MKSFTDIEQSKKLAEILPVESADMWWREVSYGFYHIEAEIPKGWYDVPPKGIPCWSLAALIDIFPCNKESPIVNLTRGGWNPSFTRRWFATWEDEDKNILYSADGINSVDAVVNLIIKLNEKDLI